MSNCGQILTICERWNLGLQSEWFRKELSTHLWKYGNFFFFCNDSVIIMDNGWNGPSLSLSHQWKRERKRDSRYSKIGRLHSTRMLHYKEEFDTNRTRFFLKKWPKCTIIRSSWYVGNLGRYYIISLIMGNWNSRVRGLIIRMVCSSLI